MVTQLEGFHPEPERPPPARPRAASPALALNGVEGGHGDMGAEFQPRLRALPATCSVLF